MFISTLTKVHDLHWRKKLLDWKSLTIRPFLSKKTKLNTKFSEVFQVCYNWGQNGLGPKYFLSQTFDPQPLAFILIEWKKRKIVKSALFSKPWGRGMVWKSVKLGDLLTYQLMTLVLSQFPRPTCCWKSSEAENLSTWCLGHRSVKHCQRLNGPKSWMFLPIKYFLVISQVDQNSASDFHAQEHSWPNPTHAVGHVSDLYLKLEVHVCLPVHRQSMMLWSRAVGLESLKIGKSIKVRKNSIKLDLISYYTF